MNITRQMIAAAHDVTMRHKIVLGHELLGEIYQAMKSASPAQRKPLTDDRLEEMWEADTTSADDCKSLYYFKVVARAIEAAHGITGEQK